MGVVVVVAFPTPQSGRRFHDMSQGSKQRDDMMMMNDGSSQKEEFKMMLMNDCRSQKEEFRMMMMMNDYRCWARWLNNEPSCSTWS